MSAKRDLTPNSSWHSVRNRDLPEVFLHIFPERHCPCLSQEIQTAQEGFIGSLWELQPQTAQGYVSTFLWCSLRPCCLFQAQGHQHSLAAPEQEIPQSPKSANTLRQLGYNTPRAVTGGFFVFFFAKSGLGTHRILLPLLAFLSTFFLILLRSFWMANHCLGNAERENNFRALNTL